MSFGGQSNAPWQRNVMQGHPQSNTFHQGTQQMFMQNAQQNNMAAFGHGGMQAGGGNMFPSGGGGGGPSVAYPQARSGLNPVAFQQSSGQSQSHYNSIGTVTKINNDCGLVNDEVFFYRNVCKGPEPKLGDRVIFEATYANNGQFKWNATRIQLMQQQPQPLMGSNKSSYGSVVPPNEYQRSQMRHNSPKRSPIRGGGRHERDRRERERPHRSRDRDDEHDRKRRREDRSHDKGNSGNSRGAVIEARSHAAPSSSGARSEREKERGDSRKGEREVADREREEREREREKDRARDKEMHRGAPKGRRARTIKRYMVQIPKALLLHKTTDVHDLRHRYTTLYIPSDFFHANIKWSDTFTPDNPFSLRRPCQFHIMHKMVEPPVEQKPEHLEPADANYLYSAKVMLMALPPISEIYKNCFETDDDDIDHHAVHPSRLINFLVGVRGRNEPMAIGGPWSPSLDGENPDKDPSVLIRTAIRTCKALTGIDLSNCTQWYRFTELYYHRTEYKNMEKDGPPRVETVVIYLPDVHSCVPSTEEWQTLSQVYTTAADDVIARRKALVDAATAAAAAAAISNDDNDKTDETNMTDNDATLAEDDDAAADKSAAEKDESEMETSQTNEDEDEKMDESEAAVDVSGDGGGDDDHAEAEAAAEDEPSEDIAAEAEAAEQKVTAHVGDDNDNEKDEPAPEPTHYSLLDLKNMKVQEIRDELLARNLTDKGVRNVVMARLAKALNTEKAEETKNKCKPKFQQTPQKTAAAKKLNVSSDANKSKKGDDKMDVDQTTSKPEDKKTTDNKKTEKKDDLKSKKIVAKPKPKVSTDKKAANKSKNDIEEQEDWADIIDFELSDIVILDEYDSSKNPEESIPKEMDEREKSQLVRRYTLPATPQIVVHPNKNAKGGKFDCAVMSLSVLLDYHPDDTKERFFEVSLFAELFNEMLMRDFAFNIYKEIYLYEDTTTTNNTSETADIKDEDLKKEKAESVEEVKKETKEKDPKKEVKEKEAKKDIKEKSSKEDTKPTLASETNSNSEKSSKDQHNDDTQSIKSESRKRKLSTTASTANGSGKDKESTTAADKKMVVVKPQLLLSFVYFDTTHCGYIFEKDLEELFSLLGLNLSRSQIKKVLGKLATRQAIYYRKLTDKEESLESIPCIEDVDDLPTEELQLIAAGNNQFEAVFGKPNETNHMSTIDGEDNKDGLMNFNGAVIHVGKLINQIKRTEKNYSDLEKLQNDLLKQHSDLQKEQNKSTTKIKDLQAELKSVSRKLTDATQDLYSLNRKYRDQNSTLSYIYTRVAPYFVREKDKDKDAKSESSRDKDDKEKEKEKDKSKDTEKEKDKDSVKDDKEKEKVKEDKEKEKEKLNDDKEKEKINDDKEKEIVVKEVKEKEIVKDIKEKEKVKENEKVKEDKEKEKVKEDKEKEKVKEDKEKEKPKEIEKEKEKLKDEKEKEKPKEIEKEKEKVKETEKEKAKDIKEKVKPIKTKESSTPAKVINKTLSTPAKVMNKTLSTPSKVDGKLKKPADKVVNVSAKK